MIELSVGLLITSLVICFICGGLVGVSIMCIMRCSDEEGE